MKASVWFDKWCELGSLDGLIRLRDIFRVGFDTKNKVADLIDANAWKWPEWWLDKYPFLQLVPSTVINEHKSDKLYCVSKEGVQKDFFVRNYGNLSHLKVL